MNCMQGQPREVGWNHIFNGSVKMSINRWLACDTEKTIRASMLCVKDKANTRAVRPGVSLADSSWGSGSGVQVPTARSVRLRISSRNIRSTSASPVLLYFTSAICLIN